MSRAVLKFSDSLSGAGLKVGIVQARFNDHITDGLLERCVTELERLQVAQDAITIVSVPGALEVPFALQELARSMAVDCMIALGCVVRGDTYHFELVCNESGRGVTDVGLATGIPIANAILTVESDAQAKVRLDKGRDAARVAVEMALLSRRLRAQA